MTSDFQVIKNEHPIDTLHGAEFAAMLIDAQIPFRVEFPHEHQSWFYVSADHLKEALDRMMKLRASKL